MSVKCSNCGLVSFTDNDACRRCGMALSAPGPGGWYPEPQNPGSVVDAAPSYGTAPGGGAASQNWGSSPQGWPPQSDGYGQAGYGNQGYGNQGYDGGYASQAFGGTQGTYAPSYGQQGQYGGYAPGYGHAGYMATPYVMADRGMRLLASIVDGVVMYGPFGLCILFGVMVGDAAILVGALLGFIAILAMLVVQIVMLCQRGQTIGKRMLGIRIVKHDTGENGGGVPNVVLRGVVPAAIGLVPYIGPLFSLINICFIFAADRRCIHDHIAGTIVVQGDP